MPERSDRICKFSKEEKVEESRARKCLGEQAQAREEKEQTKGVGKEWSGRSVGRTSRTKHDAITYSRKQSLKKQEEGMWRLVEVVREGPQRAGRQCSRWLSH